VYTFTQIFNKLYGFLLPIGLFLTTEPTQRPTGFINSAKTSGRSINFEQGTSGIQCISPVIIYRKSKQWTTGLLYGKTTYWKNY